MRILHTSDWHIGRFLNGYSLLEDQNYFLNWLLNLIKEEGIDVLIVAGDIYNTASPSSESVGVLDEFFSKVILELNRKVLIISGNHDSPKKLGFSSNILEKAGFIISTSLNDIKNFGFNCGNFSVGFVLLPYFSLTEAKEKFLDKKILNFDMASKEIYKKYICKKLNFDVNILVAHGVFFDFGKENLVYSDSETVVGGCESANISHFSDFSYIALGHLHGPQKAGYNGFYSGSPLKYSVGEAGHKKQVTLIDILSPNNIKIKRICVDALRDLIIKKGSFKELLKFKTKDFVAIKLTDENFVLDPYTRLKENMPNLLELEYVNITVNPQKTFNIYRKQPTDKLFEQFYKFVTGEEIGSLEKTFLDKVLNEIEKEKSSSSN